MMMIVMMIVMTIMLMMIVITMMTMMTMMNTGAGHRAPVGPRCCGQKMMMIVIITKKIMMIAIITRIMMGAVQDETLLADIKDMMTLWSSGSVTFVMFPNPPHPL